MENNSVSPLPPPEAPLAMMENEKTPPRSPASVHDMPPPPVDAEKRYDHDDPESAWNCGSWFEYILVVILSTVLLIGVLALTVFWIVYYRGGFAWSDSPEKQFNLHPVLMVAGFITFSGLSMLLYRICRCIKHIYIKLLHMFLHACAIPCIVIAFLAVWDFHNLSNPPIPNFYSLHSWLGLVTMGLFSLQFIVGFFSFLILLCCEDATYSCRSGLVPIHASFGVAIFWLSIATCVTGLTEKTLWTLGQSYNEFIDEGIVVNSIGAILVALGILLAAGVRRSNAPANAKVCITERL